MRLDFALVCTLVTLVLVPMSACPPRRRRRHGHQHGTDAEATEIGLRHYNWTQHCRHIGKSTCNYHAPDRLPN